MKSPNIQSHVSGGKIPSYLHVSTDVFIFLTLNTQNDSEGNRVVIKQGFQIVFIIHAKYDVLSAVT